MIQEFCKLYEQECRKRRSCFFALFQLLNQRAEVKKEDEMKKGVIEMISKGEINIMLDDSEQSLLIRVLAEFRDRLIRAEKPTEAVDKMIVKIVNTSAGG